MSGSTIFKYTGRFVTYAVPTTGYYDIVAYGAQGGARPLDWDGGGPGGLGAEIGGDVLLTAGEQLTIAVGGAGGAGRAGGGPFAAAGGGGGSFVVGPDNMPLMIAGGGGGGGASPGGGGANSQVGTAGGDGQAGGGTGGVAGNGGDGANLGLAAPYDGGGGGGFNSGGIGYGGGEGGASFLNGGTGGAENGGFGGGGGGGYGGRYDGYDGDGGGGGGGGYSGGGGGGGGGVDDGPAGEGGGGGSFDGGTNQVLVAGENSGDGKVVITPPPTTTVSVDSSDVLDPRLGNKINNPPLAGLMKFNLPVQADRIDGNGTFTLPSQQGNPDWRLGEFATTLSIYQLDAPYDPATGLTPGGTTPTQVGHALDTEPATLVPYVTTSVTFTIPEAMLRQWASDPATNYGLILVESPSLERDAQTWGYSDIDWIGSGSSAPVLSFSVAAAPPVVVPETLGATYGTPVTYSASQLLAGDTDPQGGTLGITAVSGKGVKLHKDGSVTYTPPKTAVPGDTASFHYTVTDPAGLSSTATATVRLSEDLVIDFSADIWKHRPQFIVTIDGVQQGGTHTTSANHSAGQEDALSFPNLSSGEHDVKIAFINDEYKYGGGPRTDTNLYVDSLDYAGHHYAPEVGLYSDGIIHFTVGKT